MPIMSINSENDARFERTANSEFSAINLFSSEDSTKGPAPDHLATQEYAMGDIHGHIPL